MYILRAYQSPASGTHCGPQCAHMPNLASRYHSGASYARSDSHSALNGPSPASPGSAGDLQRDPVPRAGSGGPFTGSPSVVHKGLPLRNGEIRNAAVWDDPPEEPLLSRGERKNCSSACPHSHKLEEFSPLHDDFSFTVSSMHARVPSPERTSVYSFPGFCREVVQIRFSHRDRRRRRL